jgi:hypothetical protein
MKNNKIIKILDSFFYYSNEDGFNNWRWGAFFDVLGIWVTALNRKYYGTVLELFGISKNVVPRKLKMWSKNGSKNAI